MSKTDRTVVRNAAYRKGGLSIRERHNERKNTGYKNADIIQERASLNVHFKQCDGTYTEVFDKMVADGVISTRGLKQDAKVLDELVFDVNTAYFERHGGYDYAKEFFAEAYQLAVKEAGGEQYILSAVMHADERNKALSEDLGCDMFHYHLHVVYVPVVVKEIKWSKRCKDPTLVGTTKEIIHQVSHSKKWASEKALDDSGEPVRNENGKAVLVHSYSLLQDRFFEHMQAAGYHDFERGKRGSTALHLSDLEYKVQQERQRADTLEQAIQGKQTQAATLDKKMSQKEQKLSNLEKIISVAQKSELELDRLDGIAKKAMFGQKMELTLPDWQSVCRLAREGLASRSIILRLQEQLASAQKSVKIYQTRWKELDKDTKEFQLLQANYSQQVKDFFAELSRRGRRMEPRKRIDGMDR